MSEMELLRLHKGIADLIIDAHEARLEAVDLTFGAILRQIKTAPHAQHCAAIIDGEHEAMCDCYRATIRGLCLAAT